MVGQSRDGRTFVDRGCHRAVPSHYHFLFLVLFYRLSGACAQNPDRGAAFLNEKEFDVRFIAGNASSNNEMCGNLDGCNAACSRVACTPIVGESLVCTAVQNNEYYEMCPAGSCRDKMKVDYGRGFITLPAPASTDLQPEVARDICLQRVLDSTFKALSKPSNYSFSYFGSTSGAFRAFPGREQNETQCKSFDPRWRPWFLNGVSVSRDLKILVDVGNSMRNLVILDYNRPPGTTYLDVAKNITRGLLQALSPGDDVEIIAFDSTTATSLGGKAFQINSSYDYLLPSGHPELAPLISQLDALATSSVSGALSDMNGAILKAAQSFNQRQSLKNVVVLSNGLFVVNSTTFPSSNLRASQAKLMLFKLPSNDDGGDRFLLKTSLQKDICSVNGSFEALDALATLNPLFSMRRYFTFLARVQLSAVGGNVTWSNKYASVSQGQYAITPTYPAFDRDGLLIGVAGIDVIIDKLDEPLKASVLQDFKSRNRGTLQAPASIPMTCYYQNSSPDPVCSDSTVPDSSAICPRTDTSSTLRDRTCCGTCGPGNTESRDGLKVGTIAGIAIAAVLALIAIGSIGFGIAWWRDVLGARAFWERCTRWCRRWCGGSTGIEDIPFTGSGAPIPVQNPDSSAVQNVDTLARQGDLPRSIRSG